MQLTQQLFRSDVEFQAPQVGCQPTPDTFLVSWVPGERLDGLCNRPDLLFFRGWLDHRKSLLESAGRWLRVFHGASRECTPSHFDGIRRFVANRQTALRHLPVDVAKKLSDGLQTAVSAEMVRVHGDFAPHNILVDRERLTVIDFAGINEFDRETPWFDAAAMIVALECAWRRRRRNLLRWLRGPVEAMIASFLKGYGAPDHWPSELLLTYGVQHLTRLYAQENHNRASAMVGWHVRRLSWAMKQL
jgi:hypothetical protein